MVTCNPLRVGLVKSLAALVVAFGSALAGAPGAMAETTWKIAFKQTLESPDGQILTRFTDLVDKYTNGEIKATLYPSEQLGEAQATLELLSTGAIDIYAEDVGYLEKWSPEITWTLAPFLFDDREHLLRFFQSDYMVKLVDKAEQEGNVTVIGDVGPILQGPYRVLLANKPIGGIEDIDGLKLRIWDQDLIVDVWTALGARVEVLGWNDVYQSIQTGLVDAVTAPVALVESMKFAEVAPHIVRTDEFSQATALMINKDSWDALTDAQEEAVLRAYAEAGEFSQELVNTIAKESLARLVENGATYDEIDTAPFIKIVSDYYKKLAETGELPKELLDAVSATRKPS